MKKNKNLDLIIILASITVLALITAVVLLTRPYEARSLEDIKTVNVDNYKTMNKMKVNILYYYIIVKMKFLNM